MKLFWTNLLEREKTKTTLHSNINPALFQWIGTSAGKSGVAYNYGIANEYGQVELYLDRGKDYPDLNKQRFDELNKHKEKIEKVFGKRLSWERLDKRRASRIAFRISGIGLRNKDRWPELQDKMVNAMIGLEKATKSFIRNLK